VNKNHINSSVTTSSFFSIAIPTSAVLKSIYRVQNYKTQVNNEHLKIGITKDSFESRSRCYYDNFDNEVEFIPLITTLEQENTQYELLLD